MTLLERDESLAELDAMLAAARNGHGHIALIHGEAGIGKTTLLTTFVDQVGDTAHVLWGTCDDLVTPRPLGPLWDMSLTEPALGAGLKGDRNELFQQVLELLVRGLRPTMLVVEDVHWIDDATLDLVKFLGRRIRDTSGLVVLTVRDGDVKEQRVRAALADLPSDALVEISLQPLSKNAVSELLADSRQSDELWELTGGNPFFLSEVAASGHGEVPRSVGASVTARVSRLSDEARNLVELSSVVPGGLELGLAESMLGDPWPSLAECEQAAILLIDGDRIGFRHELARRAVEEGLSDSRSRRLNLDVLTALEGDQSDLARCAHHALRAGDPEAMLRFLPAAAELAIKLSSHREALANLRALEPHLSLMTPQQLADHYKAWSWEENYVLAGAGLPIAKAEVEIRRELGDSAALGHALMGVSDLAWWDSRLDESRRYTEEALKAFEAAGGDDLAYGYIAMAENASFDCDVTTAWHYLDLAEPLLSDGLSTTRAYFHRVRSEAIMFESFSQGIAELEATLRMAEEMGDREVATICHYVLSWAYLNHHDLENVRLWNGRGRVIVDETDLVVFKAFFKGLEAAELAFSGEWDVATGLASEVVDNSDDARARIEASWVLTRIGLRRGGPGASDQVLDVWKQALNRGEFYQIGHMAQVVAEMCWLKGGLPEEVLRELLQVAETVRERGAWWFADELLHWLNLAGVSAIVPEGAVRPYRALVEGDWASAADQWGRLGHRYERAVALSRGDVAARITALGLLDELGADPLATRIRRELRDEGVPGVPRRPRRARKENDFGLTPRQAEILELLTEGRSNGEIADTLYLSLRTVENHVSAILVALGASNRNEAVKLAGLS